AHNLQLITASALFSRHRRPLLLGLSRKSFFGALLNTPVHDRLGGGLAMTLWCIQQGVQMFRTHDVSATCQAIQIWEMLSRSQAFDGMGTTSLASPDPMCS